MDSFEDEKQVKPDRKRSVETFRKTEIKFKENPEISKTQSQFKIKINNKKLSLITHNQSLVLEKSVNDRSVQQEPEKKETEKKEIVKKRTIITHKTLRKTEPSSRILYLWGKARLFAKFCNFPKFWYTEQHKTIIDDRRNILSFYLNTLNQNFWLENLKSQIYETVKVSVNSIWSYQSSVNILVNKNLMKEFELQIENIKIIEDVCIKYQGKADELHLLVTSILSEFMENVNKVAFNPNFLDFLKILTLDRTFFPSGIFFEDILNRFHFRKNGMVKKISEFQKKALLIDIFIHKGQIDKVLRTPFLLQKDSPVNFNYRINQKIICSVIYIAFQNYIDKFCPTIKNPETQNLPNKPYKFSDNLFENCMFKECKNFKRIDALIMPTFQPASTRNIDSKETNNTLNKCIFEDLLETKDQTAYFMDKNRIDQQNNQVYNITENLQSQIDEHEFTRTLQVFPDFPEKVKYNNDTGKIYLERVRSELATKNVGLSETFENMLKNQNENHEISENNDALQYNTDSINNVQIIKNFTCF